MSRAISPLFSGAGDFLILNSKEETVKATHRIILALMISLSMMAGILSALSAKPVLADTTVLKWHRSNTPGSISDKHDIVSPSEVNRIAIGSDGKTFYAVDIPNANNADGAKALYKSTDSGISWNDTISKNIYHKMSAAEQSNFHVWDIAIAPDNVNFIAAVTNDSTSNLPRNVWVSSDGGAGWENTNCPANDNISAVDISPSYGNRDIAIGTRTGAGNGTVWVLKAPDYNNWIVQGLTGDIMALKFSPSYTNDATLVVVCSDASGTYLNSGIRDFESNSTNWDIAYGASRPEITARASGTSPKANQIISADLDLPGDFLGQSPSLRRYYVSTDDDGATSDDGIFRIDNAAVYHLMPATQTKRIASIAYHGTFASGKLLAGEVLGNPCSATVMTWFTDAPITCPIPCWYPAMKPPTGAAGAPASGYDNSHVAWSPDGTIAYAATSSSGVLIPGANWPNPYLTGQDLDESAFSLSLNNGETWNQLALIDTKITRFTDIAPSPDCSTIYLASVNENPVCSGFDSVWRSQSSPIGSIWERVLCTSTSDQICPTNQADAAMLSLAGDKANGATVFWVATGTHKMMWSPDFGDYWTRIAPDLPIQDTAAEDSRTLYTLSSNGRVQKFTYSGTGWVPDAIIETGLDTGYSIATAYTGLTPDNDKGHIIVGGTGTGNYDVAYSTDGGVSFTPITTQLPTRGNTMVIASSSYKSGGYLFAINPGGMYVWSVYYGGGGDWSYPSPEAGEWATAWGGASWPTPVNALATSRNGSLYFSDAYGAYIRWAWAGAGLDWSVSFGTEPTRRLRVCGGLGLGEPVTIWLIDQQEYNPPLGGIWCYTDTLLWSGPVPVQPVSQSAVDFDPVSGRASEINLKWKPVSLSRGYRIEIAKDEDFSLKVADIGSTWGEKTSVLNHITASTTAASYVPPDPDAPALVIPPGGGQVTDSNGETWAIPALEAGHTYYWRVTVQDVATGDAISSPSSWREMFTVKAGLPVRTPYYGLQLLAPDNGCLGCPAEQQSFSWMPYRGTTRYRFALAKNPAMTQIVVDTEVPTTSYQYPGKLDPGTNYFWRVMAFEPQTSDWSTTFCFQSDTMPDTKPQPHTSGFRSSWIGLIIAIGVALDISLLVLIIRRRQA